MDALQGILPAGDLPSPGVAVRATGAGPMETDALGHGVDEPIERR